MNKTAGISSGLKAPVTTRTTPGALAPIQGISAAARQAAALTQQKAVALPAKIVANPVEKLLGMAPGTGAAERAVALRAPTVTAAPRTAASRLFGTPAPVGMQAPVKPSAAARLFGPPSTEPVSYQDDGQGSGAVYQDPPQTTVLESSPLDTYQDLQSREEDDYATDLPALPIRRSLSVTNNPTYSQAKQMTLWQKILGWFGLAPAARMNGEGMSRGEAVKTLVDRARAGDQNAMAVIVSVRENARRGSAKALASANLIGRYINRNPAR